MRDHNENWIMDFNCCLGNCLIFGVELWEILNGVLLLQEKFHDKVLMHYINRQHENYSDYQGIFIKKFQLRNNQTHNFLQKIKN